MGTESRRWLLAVLGLATCLLAASATRESCGDEEGGGRDWQAWANGQSWKFKPDETDPLFCALRRNGKFGAYEIDLRIQRGGQNIAIDVIDDQIVKHSWMGHRRSVFVIKDERLYYADFREHSTRASVVAVDLAQGQVLWHERCRGIGPVGHSAYQNLINLGVGDDVVVVWGRESLGRYVEVKRLSDGKTVGHKKFPRE